MATVRQPVPRALQGSGQPASTPSMVEPTYDYTTIATELVDVCTVQGYLHTFRLRPNGNEYELQLMVPWTEGAELLKLADRSGRLLVVNVQTYKSEMDMDAEA